MSTCSAEAALLRKEVKKKKKERKDFVAAQI